MSATLRLPACRASHAVIAALGALLALALYPVWGLETRWILALVAVLVLLSVCMMFASRLSDFLLLGLFFSMPLAGIAKQYFPSYVPDEERGNVLYSGTLGIGLVEVLLGGLYLTWFYRLFVTREQRLPRPVGIDWLIVLLIGAHCLSLWNAPDRFLGLLATLYLVKIALLYWYVSRNMRARHLAWFVTAAAFALVLETGLGAAQTVSGGGLVGIGKDKGAGGSELGTQYETQYDTARIERTTRAEGTATDSHELGHFFALLLPLVLCIALAPELRPPFRWLGAAVFVLGLAGLAITFSRSAMIGFGLAMGLLIVIHASNWHGWKAFPILVLVLVLGSVAALGIVPAVAERYAKENVDQAMDLRWQQYRTGVQVWLMSPVFGYGAGNHMHALKLYGDDFTSLLPVHNMPILIASETGLLGVAAYYSIWLAALWRCWRLIRSRSGLSSRMALGVFAGLVASFLDSLTEPLVRAPVVFVTYWLLLAMTDCLISLRESEEATFGLAQAPA
jgi:hypothetical protein